MYEILFTIKAFDIFEPMKNLLKSQIFRNLLLIGLGLAVFIIIMNTIVMPWYVSEPETQVPDVVGLQAHEAENLLKDNKLEPVISDTTYDEKYEKGSIILQKPSSGEKVKIGRRIYLFISGGEPVVHVPSLKGKSLRDAKFSLERLGLNLGQIDSVSSNNPKDMVFDQQFAAGTPLRKGDSVGISISIGEGGGEIIVPDLIGRSLAEAEKVLADSSLKVGRINYQQSFSLLPNTVLDQYPSKGNKVNPGDAVDLFVTKTGEGDNQKEKLE